MHKEQDVQTSVNNATKGFRVGISVLETAAAAAAAGAGAGAHSGSHQRSC